MLFQNRIRNIATHYPQLSSIWIKTGDKKTPLKRVWISEAELQGFLTETQMAETTDDSAELAEDHLCFAA
jgi:hypothetical protein